MEVNPYAPPQTDLLSPMTEAEGIRRSHLAVEKNLRSIAIVYFFLAAAMLGGVINGVLVVDLLTAPDGKWLFGQLVLALALGSTGFAFLKFKVEARWAATALALAGLPIIPLGTIIGFYVLYQVHSKRGRFILSPAYRPILAATSHLESKSKLLPFALTVLLVLLIIRVMRQSAL